MRKLRSVITIILIFSVFMLFGLSAQAKNAESLYIGGEPFGVNMAINGLVVVDTGAVSTENGEKKPWENIDIKKGDIIIKANGKVVTTVEDLKKVFIESGSNPTTLTIIRNEENITLKVTAVKDTNGEYKSGIFVKNIVSGLGTISFYTMDDESVFGALGHGICDANNGEVLPLKDGKIYNAEVIDVKKGQEGAPGELRGVFQEKEIGTLEKNTSIGVFGKITEKNKFDKSKVTEIQNKKLIEKGKAEIITTISGATPNKYNVEIEEIIDIEAETKNMVVHVTDEELINKTGGIVQGMSGSPILQKGKIIGVLTHVFVNDPTRGYGLVIENMLNQL